jgi:glycosyltransferase involved in cell wall biosynthesis
MRIVIDMQSMQTDSRYRGIGRYSMALTQAIARNANQHEIWIILNDSIPETIAEVRNSLKDFVPLDRVIAFETPRLVSWENPSNAWRRRAAELIRLSFISELEPDIVHVTSLFEGANLCDAVISIDSFGLDAKIVVTLYDLIPFLNPKNYLGVDWARQWYSDKINNLKQANLLLSISESSRQEAITFLGIHANDIVNISSAHTDIFMPCVDDATCREVLFSKYGITKSYLIYNGALEARKNLDGLLRAFALLPLSLRNTHQLVFAGKVSEYERERLAYLATSLGISEQFILTGYVSDNDLVALFTYCTLFVFPSLHEGFGLPALEAMACGAPTIGSNTTSIPEVIGRADALFDPHIPDEIAKKIAEVLSDENFIRSLREHALLQASKFSWDNCAKRAISAFEEVNKRKSANKLLNSSEISERRARSYYDLIEAIARIPHEPVGPSDADLVNVARCIASNRSIINKIVRSQRLPERIKWRIEGPFDSSYSLALVNRETARGLAQIGHEVILHSTEGPGDYPANEKFLVDNPDLAEMYRRSFEIKQIDADITSRNLYPPRVIDMDCRLNFLHAYGWEESGFPVEWVNNFNESLQGITVLSEHVRKVLIDNGVSVPIEVCGAGVDHWSRISAQSQHILESHKFRFLHVSSCFPRKGIDVMLEAYGQAFQKNKEVTLIIKTFKNPHNEIEYLLNKARSHNPDFPSVQILFGDYTDSEMKALYEECDALIAPSRAEGFGLPMAEALLSGLAVITTGWGGQVDFCNENTAWLIDYKFTMANTHFGLFDSVWAEPDVEHLAATIRKVYETPLALRNKRVSSGKQLLLEKFKWTDVAERLVTSARLSQKVSGPGNLSVGWVSTWNARCGIASYSVNLVKNMSSHVAVFAPKTADITQQDGPEVSRCWLVGEEDALNELSNCIYLQQIDVLVIQFNYGLFGLEKFGSFLTNQLDAGRVVVLIMHSTSDPVHVLPHKRLEIIRESLARCHRILVHTPGDLNRLKALGLVDNVTLFPHGIRDYVSSEADHNGLYLTSKKSSFIIASYGFFLPHKGLLELIEAVALLKRWGIDVQLNMVNAEYPVPDSILLINQVKETILALGLNNEVRMFTDFLEDNESLALLSGADLIVYPYQETGESSSAAVRSGLATGRPVAVTPLSIFDDVDPAVFKLPGISPNEMARGIQEIFKEINENSKCFQKKSNDANRWRAAHRFSILGKRLNEILKSI